MYIEHCTLHTVQCIVYIVYYTVYTDYNEYYINESSSTSAQITEKPL